METFLTCNFQSDSRYVTTYNYFNRFSSGQKGAESHDLVANLKIELERCLLSNKEKRIQVNKLQEELRTCKKDLEEFRMRCERAEKSESDLKVYHHERIVSKTRVSSLTDEKFFILAIHL